MTTPVYLYHGTSRAFLASIESDDITAPSYWTHHFDVAQDYAKSYGDEQAVVLCCVMSEHEFEANMQVAQCLQDDGEIDSLPECDDLLFSLEYLEGVVSQNTIRDFTVVARALSFF